MVSPNDRLPNDRLRLPPPWISPAAGMPDREVRPVIIVQRRRLLYPAYVQDYLDRVTAADVAAGNTSGLEVGVTDGANTFIQDLVSDTYLGVSGGVISQAASVIKASVPMAGARTRLGAMTPLVGPDPTSFNFGNNDYNRKTGLLGNGLDKYLDSNRNNNADPQNSKHITTYVTTAPTVTCALIGARQGTSAEVGSSQVIHVVGPPATSSFRINNGALENSVNGIGVGLVGASRTGATALNWRHSSSFTGTSSLASETPFSINIHVFQRNGIGGNVPTNARLPFYSIGESLDLAILDARVTALINAYAAAIP
jgi:hypothetical protein